MQRAKYIIRETDYRVREKYKKNCGELGTIEKKVDTKGKMYQISTPKIA